MASEAQLRISLQIKKGTSNYRPPNTSFQADVTSNFNGPTPGAVTVTVNGTDITFAQLTAMGGLCRLENTDATNYVEYGIWDPATRVFYPLGQILPGEFYVMRTSPNLQKDEPGTGTGPASGAATMRFKAHQQSCICIIDAFDP